LRITRGRCRTLCKIKRNRLHGRSARARARLITLPNDDAALMILLRYCT
jgi:hypothetical protein